MEPLVGTTRWLETDPDPILEDPDLAGLIVRIGMAANVLTFHARASVPRPDARSGVTRQRDNLCSLATTASFTFEGKRLAQKYFTRLRPLVERARGTSELLQRIGELCAGKHPASALLERARNSFGFHWDYKDEYIGEIVRSFGRNETIIWIEEATVPNFPNHDTVHRLASEVLAHGLLPDTAAEVDPIRGRQLTEDALSQLKDAMQIIAEFFTTAVGQYLLEIRCRVRRPDATTPS